MHTETISYLIEQFRSGEEETALRGLIELPGEAVPQLIESFRAEKVAPIRALLVKGIWERRDPALIPFLGEALHDKAEEVWQEALDGLVTLASAEALDVLQSAKTTRLHQGEDARRFQLWVEEALQQVRFELRR